MLHKSLNRKKGVILLEAIIAITVLSLVTTFIIQAISTSLRSSEKVRDSFEASFLLENLIFDIKSDEGGERFAKPGTGKLSGIFTTPNAYSYNINSKLIGETKDRWGGGRKVYQDFDLRLIWKEGREYLVAKTVMRIKPQPASNQGRSL